MIGTKKQQQTEAPATGDTKFVSVEDRVSSVTFDCTNNKDTEKRRNGRLSTRVKRAGKRMWENVKVAFTPTPPEDIDPEDFEHGALEHFDMIGGRYCDESELAPRHIVQFEEGTNNFVSDMEWSTSLSCKKAFEEW